MTADHADAPDVFPRIEHTGEQHKLILDRLEGPLAMIEGTRDELRNFAARLYVEVDRALPMDQPIGGEIDAARGLE